MTSSSSGKCDWARCTRATLLYDDLYMTTRQRVHQQHVHANLAKCTLVHLPTRTLVTCKGVTWTSVTWTPVDGDLCTCNLYTCKLGYTTLVTGQASSLGSWVAQSPQPRRPRAELRQADPGNDPKPVFFQARLSLSGHLVTHTGHPNYLSQTIYPGPPCLVHWKS